MKLTGDLHEPLLYLAYPPGRLPRYQLMFQAIARELQNANGAALDQEHADVRAVQEFCNSVTSVCQRTLPLLL